MSTPEGDVSAIQAGTMEPLPTYYEHEAPPTDLQIIAGLVTAALKPAPFWAARYIDPNVLSGIVEAETRGTAQPSTEFFTFKTGGVVEAVPVGPSSREIEVVREAIVKAYFEAISKEREDLINLFINNHLVDANTTLEGKTPLLAAVATRNMRVVKQLLNSGAEPDTYGIQWKEWQWETQSDNLTQRTPLQLAASIGHLPMVKLFMEGYHCDDSKVAPDGQIALRLAISAGHREVVDYLPSRRGGEFLRWKNHHEAAIRRTKTALKKLYKFLKFFVWDLEYFFIWTVPKECIVNPIAKGCRWGWKNRKGFGPWCKYQILQTGVRVKKFGKWVWKGMKEVPKEMWKFTTEELPKITKKMATWVWKFFTESIPHAIVIVAKWLLGGVTVAGKATWNVITKFFSLLHTVFGAVVSFFRGLTFKDIWDGFCEFLHAIFVVFPKTLGSWIYAFGRTSYKVMEAMFGTLGACIWWICCGILWLVVYIPTKLWEVVQSLGGSVAKGWYEFMVWINPKA